MITILSSSPARVLISAMCRDKGIPYSFVKKGNVNIIKLPKSFKVELILREVKRRLGPHSFKLKKQHS